MIKCTKSLKLFLMLLILMIMFPANIFATDAYKTYTISIDGQEIETQTAYEASTILKNDYLQRPENLYIADDNLMYVADSGSKEIVVFDESGKKTNSIGKGILKKPTGVTIGPDNQIFVADSAKERVYIFSKTGELISEYGKPDSPLFGKKQPYKPLKLNVDRKGNIYIVGEGASNGIIQLNKAGEFLGYFGANTAEASVFQTFKNLILARTGIKKGFSNVPIAPTGIDMDKKGIVYTVTNGLTVEAIKKLNVAGSNMLLQNVYAANTAIDIVAGPFGTFYVLDANGYVYEYNSAGNLLFRFGSKDQNVQRLGVFKQPTAIEVASNGNLYIADAEQGIIHAFRPTEFTNKLHEGLVKFEEGLYVESEQYWQQVLQMNSSLSLAHIAVGQAYYKQQEYKQALQEFKLANDTDGYSQAFWEIRHELLGIYIADILFVVLLVCLGLYLLIFLDKKFNFLQGIKKLVKHYAKRKPFSELLLLFKMFRHPIDSFYEIKRMKKASVLVATSLYLLLIAELIISLYYTGFLFQSNLLERYHLLLILSIFISVLGLFIMINYLISTINDGEGSFENVYTGTIYALAPYIIFSLPITLLSQFITLNESFLYSFSTQIMLAWAFVLLFLMVKEIHDFSLVDTMKNILLTLFGCIMAVLVLFVLYILVNQVVDFVSSVIQEVMVRV